MQFVAAQQKNFRSLGGQRDRESIAKLYLRLFGLAERPVTALNPKLDAAEYFDREFLVSVRSAVAS
jgi:hypothetical protein